MANQNVLQLTQQTGSANTSSVLYAVTGGTTDTGLPLSVLFNSPSLTGTPTVAGYLTSALAASTYLTQANATSTYLTIATAASTYQTQSATTTALALKANLAGPTFTGTVVIPTVTLSGGTINSTSIGATTTSTGAFTTLAASGTVSGTGFSTYLAAPPAIGGTTPATAKFTSLQATGAFTPSTTAGIVGTTLGDSANAGSVGEYVTANATGVSLTSGSGANVTSISLTAGDWDVTGNVLFVPAGTTTTTLCYAGISTTSATLTLNQFTQDGNTYVTGQGSGFNTPIVRVNISTTTTVYLVAQAVFATSTMAVGGLIRARRIR